ncbi:MULTISPECIES: hypothetical protein [unclassified Neisseria]|uniref:hypothetical protein n=1 Tax=unclassified Neisseria TaxID=2623750 RepID=UPI002666598D|nr:MULTISPECIES: hypothetical protein [unclassified Neisseria]MDO1509132.1 hypothetical protein [Neisseria sp. MVDL19-042950]MDO1515589.1 hypothetical protein [Neisseria sp. MVDL18-041461]MDO1562948.1 hypothetical protein [Neisseria sp. MVDL20-010259]
MNKLTLTAAALLLAACSNGNNADKTTFEKTINRYASGNSVCLPIALNVQNHNGINIISTDTVLGEPVIKIVEKNLDGKNVNEQAIKQMQILDSEGLYKKGESETLNVLDSKNNIKIRVYTLTEKGQTRTRLTPQGPRFCLGKQTVKKINWFTEPAPYNGVIMTKVSYEARFEPERWAEKLLKESGKDWEHAKQDVHQTATLIKTNDGWRDIRELKQP